MTSLNRLKSWIDHGRIPERLLSDFCSRLGLTNRAEQELLDIIELDRILRVRAEVTDMELVLGRPSVPGDGCFIVRQ